MKWGDPLTSAALWTCLPVSGCQEGPPLAFGALCGAPGAPLVLMIEGTAAGTAQPKASSPLLGDCRKASGSGSFSAGRDGWRPVSVPPHSLGPTWDSVQA